ncbi:hypothetical protein [Roseicella sp. DB1501]|uniref:hypothetical protein n=1 Tax=Roseicella sp. DB1501 TaxID=2730925 RepID=UPI001492EB34|nr:hypothetical protein [Roseicella sp. DB1501]NOG74230.1 hypothetical protein [Roseicella sp. DB1501]
MRIRQLVGRDWAKSALLPDEWCENNPKEAERRLKNSERLRAAVLREARQTRGRVLVVAQKGVVDYWKQCGPLPSNVELAWHNAVAGRDEWGPGPGRPGISLLIVVGRTLPRPWAAEMMAEALTGAAVSTSLAGPYERREAHIRLRNGSSVPTEAEHHPDPTAEAIRQHICEGELLQIIGRARGVNRTAANPVDVLVLTDRPLSIPVNEVVSWESLEPSPWDVMMSMGGVALKGAADAYRAYPVETLWTSPAAAKKALQRSSGGHSPNSNSLLGNVPHCRRATYQKAGARQRPSTLVYDPSVVPDLQDWLEERLGPLAWLKDDAEAEAKPPAPTVSEGLVGAAAQTLPPVQQSAHAAAMPIRLPADLHIRTLEARLGAPRLSQPGLDHDAAPDSHPHWRGAQPPNRSPRPRYEE